LSTEPFAYKIFESAHSSSVLPPLPIDVRKRGGVELPSQAAARNGRSEPWAHDDGAVSMRLSRWSNSRARRVFDCICVLLALPLVAPLCLVVAAAVRLTSPGPALFLQERVGRHGRTFTILKFRTMDHLAHKAHHAVTTADNQRFTPIGRFLRRWKLDEVPQLLNVLLGHMSLIGPRPRIPEHVICRLSCRPGITGWATMVFANEETVLARVPADQLNAFYHAMVLPMKRRLDAHYMARATFLSDLQLLVNSVLRRWNNAALEALIFTPAGPRGKATLQEFDTDTAPQAICADELAPPEQVSA
jgi:lipopolysaccharide/colanic/teichoic acid biosynthesis glycosyltransferase